MSQLKHSALQALMQHMVTVEQSNIEIFHHLTQVVTIFRICFFACADCRQHQCLKSPLRPSRGNRSRHRLARFERNKLNGLGFFFVSTRGPTTLDPGLNGLFPSPRLATLVSSHKNECLFGEEAAFPLFVLQIGFESWQTVTMMISHPRKYLG